MDGGYQLSPVCVDARGTKFPQLLVALQFAVKGTASVTELLLNASDFPGSPRDMASPGDSLSVELSHYRLHSLHNWRRQSVPHYTA